MKRLFKGNKEVTEASEISETVGFRQYSSLPHYAEKHVDFAKLCFLVAEDNESLLELMCRQLQILGATAEPAENGLQAVKKFEQSNIGYFQVILTDIKMPLMGGKEAAGYIRNLERMDAGAVVIIALTGYRDIEEQYDCVKAGINEYLEKPLETDKLCSILQKYLLY